MGKKYYKAFKKLWDNTVYGVVLYYHLILLHNTQKSN